MGIGKVAILGLLGLTWGGALWAEPLDRRVQASVVDDRGRIWAATWQGLRQIQGGEVRAWRSLPSDTITGLLVDRAGKLWVGTPMGLYRLDPDRPEASEVYVIHLASNHITALAMDRAGLIWAGTNRGLVRLSPHNGETFARIEVPGQSVQALQFDRQGKLWVGTLTGVYQYDAGRGTLLATHDNLPGTVVQALAVDVGPNLWVGTPQGLLAIDTQTNQVQPLRQNGTNVLAIASDKNGKIWLGSDRELVRLNPQSGEIDARAQNLPAGRIQHLRWRSERLLVSTSMGLGLLNPYQLTGGQAKAVPLYTPSIASN